MIIYRMFLPLTAASIVPSTAERSGPSEPPPSAEELFKAFDANGDGVLSRDEFKKGMEELAKRRRWSP